MDKKIWLRRKEKFSYLSENELVFFNERSRLRVSVRRAYIGGPGREAELLYFSV
jgi:hypothetical protein